MISSVYLINYGTAPRHQRGSEFLPRDDAGQFDSNRIGPKKRLAYETGTERELRGQRTLDFAPWS